jgi:predicted aldo/keto reductase-like oxidoreductase
LGRTGFTVSDIGMGNVTNEAVIEALLNSGVNYIDTSGWYQNGNGERIFAKAIEGFDRNKIFISTKIMSDTVPWSSKKEVIKKVYESLDRLRTDYIDFLMIHAASDTEIIKNKYFHSAMESLKKEGKIRHVGVASHGNSNMASGKKDTMEKIILSAIEDGRFDVILFIYNYASRNIGERILEQSDKHNIGTTIMKSNPLKYYASAKQILENQDNLSADEKKYFSQLVRFSEEAKLFFENNNLKSDDGTFRDLSIPYVLSNSNVGTVLYAFQNFNDIDKVLSLSGKKLSIDQKNSIADLIDSYGQILCRLGCSICEEKCPNNVPVNTIMRYNYYFTVKGEEKNAMQLYGNLSGNKPDMCIDCDGYCEKACPYNVMIRPLLSIAHKNLTLNSSLYT